MKMKTFIKSHLKISTLVSVHLLAASRGAVSASGNGCLFADSNRVGSTIPGNSLVQHVLADPRNDAHFCSIEQSWLSDGAIAGQNLVLFRVEKKMNIDQ